MSMASYKITAELSLGKVIAESREVAQALVEFADKLEQIEKKHAEPQEDEIIDCKSTKCEDCINHNDCDFETQESDE